jgi:hypothetical protein
MSSHTHQRFEHPALTCFIRAGQTNEGGPRTSQLACAGLGEACSPASLPGPSHPCCSSTGEGRKLYCRVPIGGNDTPVCCQSDGKGGSTGF